MNDQNIPSEHIQTPGPAEWNQARPKNLPRPTYWPLVLAFGILLAFFGITTTLFVSGVGLIVFGMGLAGWIGELRHES